MKKKLTLGGFTLIELMVVVAIIGILSAIIMANFAAAKSRSRDVKRISDVTTLQLALAAYFNQCSDYPAAPLATSLNATDANCPANVKLSSFISTIPVGPNSGETYYYGTNAAGSNPPTDYVLQTNLENYNNVLTGSISTGIYGATCTQSSSVFQYCIGPK